MNDKLEKPAPDQIRETLKKHGVGRTQAAAMVHVPIRTFHNWCAPIATVNHRAMPLAAWELLLIKLGERSHASRGKDDELVTALMVAQSDKLMLEEKVAGLEADVSRLHKQISKLTRVGHTT